MAGNSIGNIFALTTFGESHGPALGGIIDGCPAGLKINLKVVNDDLNRRRPGQSEIVSQRNIRRLSLKGSLFFYGKCI